MPKIFFTLFAFFTIYITLGQIDNQQKPEYTLSWENSISTQHPDGSMQSFIYFKDALYDDTYGMLPLFFSKIPLPLDNTVLQIELYNDLYQELSEQEIILINKSSIIKENVQIRLSSVKDKNANFAHVFILPFRLNTQTGKYEKLISFDISKKYDFISETKQNKTYKTTSVLANGNIYKMCLSETGVYKITHEDLVSLGINVNSINPQHIRIYGNGGGMLPEHNAVFRHDDLVENAIYVEGESDGVFNASDYILFYGQSPHVWTFNELENRFVHKVHLYSDVNCYFITADHGPGKRISTENSLTDIPTHTVNSFNDFAFHEKDSLSLIHSGKEWFGEAFDIRTEYAFSFNFPNIKQGSKVRLKSSVAARSFQNSTFNLTAAGNAMTLHISAVPTSYTSTFANMSVDTLTFNATLPNININLKYNKPTSNSAAWLNYLQFNVERNLIMAGHIMPFRHINSVGQGHISRFILDNASANLKVWDVTHPLEPKKVTTQLTGTQMSFTLSTDSLREFIAHSGASYLAPIFIGKVGNQNLHGLGHFDMIIVAHPLFISEAQRLAQAHYNRHDLSVVIVTPEQIYNEFSSGVRDIAAIRDFVKMMYDKASTPQQKPKYLLLFGDGSYDNKDRIENNTNFIPTFQSLSSLEPTSSYVTDDFFGLLDNNEGLNAEGALDIGIGRFPVQTVEEARQAVDKSIIYMSKENLLPEGSNQTPGNISNMGDWRNVVCFVADDEDGNLHISQAEYLANMVDTIDRDYNIDKIYFDAYLQQTNAGGQRYPEVNMAINNRVQKGALIVNYTGHGGELGWGHERVLEVAEINAWKNKYNMPVFVTATCEFSRFDDPKRTSAGEYVFLNPNGGGVALFSTTRLAFANTNFALNKSFYSYVFKKTNNEYPSLGELMRLSKNAIGNISSIRNFVLLGDPALKLAYPEFNVVTTLIPDTFKALSKVTIEGYIADLDGNLMTDFNGIIYPTVFDKPTNITTLANDPQSAPFTFTLQKNILFKGKVSVTNGWFSFEFIVPKDIAYQYGNGKISYYAQDGQRDANGSFEGFIIGGFNEDYEPDNQGPVVKLYMNNEDFVFGGITDENPILLAILSDESGINTTGNGIGHDITCVLDDDFTRVIVLNDYYESELNSYKNGRVVYPFYKLEEGLHNITFKVWDVHNNSSEAYLEFYVTASEELAIEHLMNYPNPFSDRTYFVFQHNQAFNSLDIEIAIFSITGEPVKTIHKTILNEGYKSEPIEWNGTNSFGNRIAKGLYIYRLTVTTEDGRVAEKTEKLILLK